MFCGSGHATWYPCTNLIIGDLIYAYSHLLFFLSNWDTFTWWLPIWSKGPCNLFFNC